MTQRYDLVIAGGGPSGSAAAWQAAQTGAKVVVLDKAEFPRDKPCGDGLTARAVSYLQKMGLADEVATFHRVNRVTVFSPSQWELSFPKRPGMPDHGHTVSRTHLDTVLLKHAESAGAEVRQSAEVTGPELDANGRVVGRDAQGRREGVRRRGHRRRRRLLPHQAGAEDRLGVQRLLGDRDPLGDARQPAGLRQPRHLSEAGVPGRPAARLRLGVPDGQRRVQHRAGLRQQLQELAVDQRDPVPRRVPADAAAATGSCRRSRS